MRRSGRSAVATVGCRIRGVNNPARGLVHGMCVDHMLFLVLVWTSSKKGPHGKKAGTVGNSWVRVKRSSRHGNQMKSPQSHLTVDTHTVLPGCLTESISIRKKKLPPNIAAHLRP